MNENSSSIELLFEKAENYSKTSAELIKLKAIDKAAHIVSSFAVKVAIFSIVAMFTFMLSIGIALWLGELLGKTYYGFFIMGGFYAVITVFIYIFRSHWIKSPVSDAIISQMLQEE